MTTFNLHEGTEDQIEIKDLMGLIDHSILSSQLYLANEGWSLNTIAIIRNDINLIVSNLWSLLPLTIAIVEEREPEADETRDTLIKMIRDHVERYINKIMLLEKEGLKFMKDKAN